MPRILAINGLTKSCLEAAMIEMTKKPEMAAQCLLENCMKETNGVKKCREFSILNCGQKIQEFNETSGEKKPVYYIFGGLNDEWPSRVG